MFRITIFKWNRYAHTRNNLVYNNCICPQRQKGSDTSFTNIKRRVPLVEQELPTLPELLSSPQFLVRFVLLDVKFYVYVLQIGVSFLYFFQPLFCLPFFDLRFFITPLVSSNSSYNQYTHGTDHAHQCMNTNNNYTCK